MNNFYSLKIEEIVDYLDSNLVDGLTIEESNKRLKNFGKNLLPEDKISPFYIFLKQFKNIFNIVLFFALFLTLILSKYSDFVVIFFIISVNICIGFFFEIRTQKTLEKLKNLFKPKVKVIREGRLIEINSEDIVIGDIVILEEGDVIPADLRFIEIDNLKVDESIITGESLPVEKTNSILSNDIPINEQKNIGFMGTYVVEGRGRGIVFATGFNTYLGKIYKQFKKIESFKSHFTKLSQDLIYKMLLLSLITSFFIFYFVIKRNYLLFDSLLFVLSSFISAIPEGLPIIITILLVISAYSLSKKNVLVKNLQATENLSNVNLILSDKTGTLTENTMVVKKIFVDNEEIEILEGKLPNEGKFLKDKKEINIFENYPLIKLLNICGIVSEAEIIYNQSLPEIKTKGNSRDVALLFLLEKAGIKREKILAQEKIIKREQFSRIKKYKKVIVEHERRESYYIGAFEEIISKCNFVLTKDGISEFNQREEILNKGLNYAQSGFSVLAVSFDQEEKSIFVGLIAIYDPPKKEVKQTLQKLKQAGIEVRMVTGDHKMTAIYIAKEIGFENLNCLEQKEIDKLTEEELFKKIKDIYIFARITPETKLKILEIYQKLGYSVAYIGDGVNDVLGLKRAEVGVCMGKRGSEIARSASDIILIDDNLESLTQSFLEGRRIFNNLKRVVFFLITTNISEHFTIITSLILGYPFILKPIHILFLNFVTDTLVGTTLAFEKEHGYELKNRPRSPKESLISLDLIPFFLLISSTMVFLTVLIFNQEYLYNIDKARTYAFLAMSLTQIYNALNLRSLNKSIFTLSFKLNPYLVIGFVISILLQTLVIFNPYFRNILSFSEITLYEFLTIFLLSSIVFWAGEIFKFFRNKLINK